MKVRILFRKIKYDGHFRKRAKIFERKYGEFQVALAARVGIDICGGGRETAKKV